MTSANPFAIGDRISHRTFGAGVVKSIDSNIAEVEFEDGECKRILLDRLVRDDTEQIVRPKAEILRLQGTSVLPRIPWVYAHYRVRGFLSALFAPGGAGKSNLLVAEALDMVTGKDLLGHGHRQKLRVWYINSEDPRDLVVRQFEAAASRHGVRDHDIGERLMISNGRDSNFVIAREDKKQGLTFVEPVVQGILAVAQEFEPDAIIIDPFISTHAVHENDNGAMQQIASMWVTIADQLNCSIDLAHHVTKSDGPVTANSGRGGGALKDKARVVRVLNPMTEDQAKDYEIDARDRRDYVHATIDKGNLSKVGRGAWLHMECVPLGNGEGMTMPQEHAPAMVRWFPPDAAPEELAAATVAELDHDQVEAILTGIKNREARLDAQAKDWAGHEVGYVLNLETDGRKKTPDRDRAERVLDALILTGKLEKVAERDPVSRRTKWFVKVPESQKA